MARAPLLSATLPVVFAATLACGGKQGPAGPSGTEKPQTLTISGVTSLRQTGDTSQLTAMALFTDGKTKDVTADTSWSGGTRASDGRPLVTVSRGRLTAVSYGWANVWASYSIVHASVTVRVGPEGMFFLSGHITESGFAVSQARVEAASPSATLSAMTDDAGYYLVPAQGDVTLRVEKDGYQSEVRRVLVAGDAQIDVSLEFGNAAGDPRGTWQLAIIASPSCALPPEARQRNYTARVKQTGQYLTVELAGRGHFWDEWGAIWGFTGTRNGTSVQFTLGSAGVSAGYSVAEWIDASRYVDYSGTASGAVGNGRIVATFNGRFAVYQPDPNPGLVALCEATDHRLEFVR